MANVGIVTTPKFFLIFGSLWNVNILNYLTSISINIALRNFFQLQFSRGSLFHRQVASGSLTSQFSTTLDEVVG
jgi:hypothetical protein